MTSKTIQDLLPCVDTGVSTEQTQALLRSERAKIDRQMAELAEARSKLDEIIEIAVNSSSTYSHTADGATRVA